MTTLCQQEIKNFEALNIAAGEVKNSFRRTSLIFPKPAN